MTLQQGTELIESFIKQLESIEKIALRIIEENRNDKNYVDKQQLRLELVRAEIGDLKHILEALRA